jgi:hypothetical protein
MENILLSVISALLGFALSQSFNFISYLRRPKFRVKHWSDGVLSSYSGDPPETPWEIELGFFLENYGKNPAKNVRIFVSDIKASGMPDGELELTSIELLELKRPIDLVPSKECIEVRLGTLSSNECALALNLHGAPDENAMNYIDADTRGKIRFSAKFYVSCEEKNSFKSFVLDFRPDKNDWASSLLEDYTEDHLISVTRPKF